MLVCSNLDSKFICHFYVSVAENTIVSADLFLRYTLEVAVILRKRRGQSQVTVDDTKSSHRVKTTTKNKTKKRHADGVGGGGGGGGGGASGLQLHLSHKLHHREKTQPEIKATHILFKISKGPTVHKRAKDKVLN